MTTDIRTAAEAEAETRWPESIIGHRALRAAFTKGAGWASARVIPTREGIEDALTERADQSDETGTTIKLDDARDAILALIQELAE